MKTLLPLLVLCALPAAAQLPPDSITVSSPRGIRRVPVTDARGFPAIAVAQLGSAVAAWDTPESAAPGNAVLRIGGMSFAFVLDAGYFRADDRVYTLAAGPYIERDSLFLPLQFVIEYLPRLTGRYRWQASRARLDEVYVPGESATRPRPAGAVPAATRPPAAPRRRVIAIDPGHGGVDVGMSGPVGRRPFLKEKDVTLAVSRFLGRELEAKGYAVVFTRDRDTLIDRDDRGAIARRGGADIFVSIHVNAANPSWRNAGSARGFETYYLAEARTEDEAFVARMENSSYRFESSAHADRGDPLAFILADLAQNEHLRESSRMAELVHASLDGVHPAVNRGVKQAGFVVLATSHMPAILVETGFGSNEAEARYLTSSSGQQRLARAIADGIGRYMAEYERRVAVGQR